MLPATELWLPTRYTPTLTGTEDFPTHGDWLLKIVDRAWRLPDGSRIVLDPWQRWLIRHVLEVFPEGHPRAGRLRFRRVVVSMGRQNGKSVLGAIFGLYGLIRESGALVIGIASSAEQARIIYTRLLAVIKGNAQLSKRFERLTDTRGISGKSGSRYEIKAAKSAAVQGLDLSVGLADELHIMKPELWTDMVNGTKARKNGIVVGITTAGDDTSTLLLDLYGQVEKQGEGSRFGFFIWEAPEALVPMNPDKTPNEALLGEYLTAANPAIACGRIDLEEAVESTLSMPEVDAVRYNLNRFVKSTNSLMPLSLWMKCAGVLEAPVRPVFAIDRTPDWGAATIAAAWKAADGRIHTQIVAVLIRPTVERLAAVCLELNRHNPKAFVADNYVLKDLLAALKRSGLTTRAITLADVTSGSEMLYAKVKRQDLVHASDPLLTIQMPKTVRKNVGTTFRISRLPGAEIDGVIATMEAVYAAEIVQDIGDQLFV